MAKVELSGKQRLEQCVTRCGVTESEPLRMLIMQALDDATLDELPDETLEQIVKGMQKAFTDGQEGNGNTW